MRRDRTKLILRAAGVLTAASLTADIEIERPNGRRVSAGVTLQGTTNGAWEEVTQPIPEGRIVWARVACDSGPRGIGRVKVRLAIVSAVWESRGEGEPLVESYLGIGRTAWRAGDAVHEYTERQATVEVAATGNAAAASLSSWSGSNITCDRVDSVRVTVVTDATVANRGVQIVADYPAATTPTGYTGLIQPASTTVVYGLGSGMDATVSDATSAYSALAARGKKVGESITAILANAQGGDTIQLTHVTAPWIVEPATAF